VAGRAGRGAAKGTVLIQTYQPDHYVFQAVQSQDYDSFFQRELESRRQLGYPPFTRLALVRLSGPLEEPVVREARRLAAVLEDFRHRDHELRSRVRILGPAPAGLTSTCARPGPPPPGPASASPWILIRPPCFSPKFFYNPFPSK
jgi:primosomal protein N' (replication factor Y)